MAQGQRQWSSTGKRGQERLDSCDCSAAFQNAFLPAAHTFRRFSSCHHLRHFSVYFCHTPAPFSSFQSAAEQPPPLPPATRRPLCCVPTEKKQKILTDGAHPGNGDKIRHAKHKMATRQAAATATFPAAEAAAAARPHRKEEVPAALIPTKNDWRAQKTPTFCCSYKAANETDRRVPVNNLSDCLLARLLACAAFSSLPTRASLITSLSVTHPIAERMRGNHRLRARTLNAGLHPPMVEEGARARTG
ncbi:hypothetical protein IWX49DRAFT_62948 [Phyllosticta citricarpa]|uniref:Uncharacterized protein n=1 Tax=Phyllosticta paracitricarpa TaxID=2016321 RepID=A0ABR1NJS0_9PEZI